VFFLCLNRDTVPLNQVGDDAFDRRPDF